MTSLEPLKIETYGIILITENFNACVHFYRDIIGLPVWYVKSTLVCFRFGNGYLMIETGGKASSQIKLNNENPTMLRFNVKEVRAAAKQLTERGVTAEIAEYDWGTVGTFADPDGNKCELKNADDPFFS